MTYFILAPLAVVLVGIAKAGFGSGVGIAAVPLFIIATNDPKASLGIMLPLLCACDVIALFHYRRTFDPKNLWLLLPGAAIGIGVCGVFLGKIGNGNQTQDFLKIFIGVISIAFVLYQAAKTWILKRLDSYKPENWHGWFFGFWIGVTSTLAHAAGPVATMYLFPQHLGRRLFVGTTVVLFAFVNALKLIPYFYHHMINLGSMQQSLILLPFVPLGTWLGVWMNQRINETVFSAVIYTILFLLGVNMITGFDPVMFFYRFFS
ncbi:MAG: sulfite exporter TauE/SafE family protein [Candidatus Omnitrophica bacterium]|nr:sulfite exporter TauE/SafE family protein [Candidatus Omnitrophota bacterium]